MRSKASQIKDAFRTRRGRSNIYIEMNAASNPVLSPRVTASPDRHDFA